MEQTATILGHDGMTLNPYFLPGPNERPTRHAIVFSTDPSHLYEVPDNLNLQPARVIAPKEMQSPRLDLDVNVVPWWKMEHLHSPNARWNLDCDCLFRKILEHLVRKENCACARRT